MFMQTVLHFFDETRGLAVFKIAPTAAFLTPGDMQTQARARNADIHQPPLFLNAQGAFEQLVARHVRQQPFLHAHQKHMWVFQPFGCVQCGQPHRVVLAFAFVHHADQHHRLNHRRQRQIVFYRAAFDPANEVADVAPFALRLPLVKVVV